MRIMKNHKCFHSKGWRDQRAFRDISVFVSFMIFVSGCTVVKNTGRSAVTMGKIVGKSVVTTGKVVGKTAKVTGKVITQGSKGLKTIVQIPVGRRVVQLLKRGNSLFVDVRMNRKIKARMLLDTGCSDTQISRVLASRLGINVKKGQVVMCKIAGGHTVSGRVVNIKEIRMNRIKVRNVRAIVLDVEHTQGYDGLLGMSFLNNFIFQIDSLKGELILKKRN